MLMSIRRKIEALLSPFLYEYVKNFPRYIFSNTQVTHPEGKTAFVFSTSINGNMGDAAIAIAQNLLLQKYFMDRVIEIPIGSFWRYAKKLRRIIREDDVIFLTGGGNMGEAYREMEIERQAIIHFWPKNEIVLFPETLSYNDYGSVLMINSIKTFDTMGRRLHLFAREKTSYQLMKQYYKNNDIHLVPDIVLSLAGNDIFSRRTDSAPNLITFSFRDDLEKSLSSRFESELKDFFISNGLSIQMCDTFIPDIQVSKDNRIKYLRGIVSKFQESSLVVTDRLHGMILAYLSSVPCLVFSNYNHKVKGVYNWISSSKSVCFEDVLSDSFADAQVLLNSSDYHIIDLNKQFYPLFSLIHKLSI